MGVAGSGKSTLAAQLAARRGASFLEADDFHSAANVAKMASGLPLTDGDRWPWLAALRRAMRGEDDVVVACSALKRTYRDALRAAGDVRFVQLDINQDVALSRLQSRPGHFMRPALLDSQITALEPPACEETDAARLLTDTPDGLVEVAERVLETLTPGTATSPLLAEGSATHVITPSDLRVLVDEVAEAQVLGARARRVLLVPPDHTRLHSRAGEITAHLYRTLAGAGCKVAVLPASGTHARMTAAEIGLLFGDGVPPERVLEHRWRERLTRLGAIAGEEVAAISDGLMTEAIPVELNDRLLRGWDVVVSIGQVVPHEVIGMANFTKNLVIGLGGPPMIHSSHFLSAISGFESIMGRINTPVRDVVDAAFDRFVAPRVPVLWLLTVVEDVPGGVMQRGLFAGRGSSGDSGGAAFRAAGGLAARCNVENFPERIDRVVCWLNPHEFSSTWLGNKAIYRTRMAIADGGELVILAPGVTRFGEDQGLDRLIRRHGYCGTDATLAAVARDPELAHSLSAAAHLIHGSSEGRFRITYCTDPARGGLTRKEVEEVGYDWRPLSEELKRLGVSGETGGGLKEDADGGPFEFIPNPGLGLWTTVPLAS
jgi:carbohydrate kinase (thermoresistant glucokinase family)